MFLLLSLDSYNLTLGFWIIEYVVLEIPKATLIIGVKLS